MSGSKYAHVERERRFLVSDLPTSEPWALRTITDLYIEGTRIRLRHSEGVVAGKPEVARKLTQKLPDPEAVGGRRGTITTMYLDNTEYERLSQLPGRWLTKQRLSFPPMGVDVFEGPLAGLIVAEVEFNDDAAMESFVAPSWCRIEVTERVDFSGANLAHIAALAPGDAAKEVAASLRSATGVGRPGHGAPTGHGGRQQPNG